VSITGKKVTVVYFPLLDAVNYPCPKTAFMAVTEVSIAEASFVQRFRAVITLIGKRQHRTQSAAQQTGHPRHFSVQCQTKISNESTSIVRTLF